MTRKVDALEYFNHAGELVLSRQYDGATLRVKATGDGLTAWCTWDGLSWYEVGVRAGGADMFSSALALRESASLWAEELERMGRIKL